MNIRSSKVRRYTGRPAPRGFSLVEVLLAIFILGIGMIMVASVFPVGANWTRQTTEESVGQQIAQDAMSVIKTYYGPGGALSGQLNPGALTDPSGGVTPDPIFQNAMNIQALPFFYQVPSSMRSYRFGNEKPYPTINPQNSCTYYWTPLCRLSPSQDKDGSGAFKASSSFKYDIYILVFHKGAVENFFSQGKYPTEINLTRTFLSADIQTYIPCVVRDAYSQGQVNIGGTPNVSNAVPPMGSIGIGTISGTVFTQRDDAPSGKAIPRPIIIFQPQFERIIYSPPAD